MSTPELSARLVSPASPTRCRINDISLRLKAGEVQAVRSPDAYLGGMLIGLLSGSYRIGGGSVQISSSLGRDELAGIETRRLARLRSGPLRVVRAQLPVSPAATGSDAVALLAGCSAGAVREQLAELAADRLADQQLGLLTVSELTLISLAAALASSAELLLCDLDGLSSPAAGAALDRRAGRGAAILAVGQLPYPNPSTPTLTLSIEGTLE